MRTIKINDELSITIDALTRRQIENLNSRGFNVSTTHVGVSPDQWDKFCDELVMAYCGGADKSIAVLDAVLDLDREKYREVMLGLVAETWGNREEEKN